MRPRLSDHIRARFHVVDGEPCVILHDEDGRILKLGVREWAVLQHADGSRDLEGLRIAAEHKGARLSLDSVRQFVRDLSGIGAFEDSVSEASPAFARDVPIVTLPGYRFRCSGSGRCCASFGTILFRPIDVARARAAVPDLEPVFMPERGLDTQLCAVSQTDGACAYLDQVGHCRIHAAAGSGAKPIGCSTFPAKYVDVGHEIRVAPRPECACIFESGDVGEPLTRATNGGELPREHYVPRLPEEIVVGGVPIPRAQAVALSDALEVPDDGDLAALCWDLGQSLRPAPFDPSEAFARVAASAERLIVRSAWRARSDHVLRTATRARDAAMRASRESTPRDRDDEALYLRIAFFQGLGAERSFEGDLRRLALVIWIARAFDPDAAHPIALVEMLARGHGLALASESGDD